MPNYIWKFAARINKYRYAKRSQQIRQKIVVSALLHRFVTGYLEAEFQLETFFNCFIEMVLTSTDIWEAPGGLL